jgi:hypothetical protein
MEDPSAVIEAHQKRVEELNGERFELEPGATSLKLLQKVYHSPSVPLSTRMRAAMAAIPFEHPKLAVTATIEAGDFADQLEQAIERSRRVIEVNTVKAIEEDKPTTDVRLKPSVVDRRYRKW